MKRILTIFICTLLLLTLVPTGALAEDDFQFETLSPPHIIVFDSNDTSVSNPILERDADTQIYPASTTKMMTCILAIENGDLNQQVTVGEEIKGLFELRKGYSESSSLMGLVVGETVSLKDLLYGLMLVSGNEAADVIAVAIGGTIQGFVDMMNAKASELGMSSTHFANPNGVQSENHYSTTRDMAKLAAYCMQNSNFEAIVATESYSVPANDVRTTELTLYNTNLLLTSLSAPQYANYKYEYCIGVKTGYTPAAGNCLVAAAEKNGARPIICLYGDSMGDVSNNRFAVCKTIFEHLFNNVYSSISSSELTLQDVFSCEIANARTDDLGSDGKLTINVDTSAISISGLPEQIDQIKANPAAVTAEVEWTDSLIAPIHQGQQLGTVTYKYGDTVIYTATLTAPIDVQEVAVLGADAAAADSLLTSVATNEPTMDDTTEDESSGFSFATIIFIILGILVLLIGFILVSSIISNNKKKKRRKQMLARKRAMERRQHSASQQGSSSREHSGERRTSDGNRVAHSQNQNIQRRTSSEGQQRMQQNPYRQNQDMQHRSQMQQNPQYDRQDSSYYPNQNYRNPDDYNY